MESGNEARWINMDEDEEERFWEQVDFGDSDDDCWLWQGPRLASNYGWFWIDSKRYWKYTHRIMAEMYYGPIPPKRVIMHSCDNPPCVNPNHLSVGTYKENFQDWVIKGMRRRR